jgi:hypothetical protein
VFSLSKIKPVLTSFGFCAIVAIVVFSYYVYCQMGASRMLNAELQQVLDERDPVRIKALAYDSTTEQYLLNLPKGAHVDTEKTSDIQGGDVVDGTESSYLVSMIDGQRIEVYMTGDRHSFLQQAFPHWDLLKLSSDRVPSIPDVKKQAAQN